MERISCFWVKIPCFGVKKPVFEGFGVRVQKTGSKTGVSEHCKLSENSEFVLFRTFRKLQKNDIKIKFQKSQKTSSDSKTNTNVGLKFGMQQGLSVQARVTPNKACQTKGRQEVNLR